MKEFLMVPRLLIIGTFVYASAALAQEKKEPEQTPTIKARTEFVQVPIIVQRSGKHVTGLTQSEFVVQQDGVDQPITAFEEIHAGSPVLPKPVSGFQNTATMQQTPQQITIIVLDSVNTDTMDMAYFRKELASFLVDAEKKRIPFGLVELTRTGMKVLHDFTTDPRAIFNAVVENNPTRPATIHERDSVTHGNPEEAAAMQPTPEMFDARVEQMIKAQDGEDERYRFQERTSRIDTLLAIQQLAQALKGIPGRKTVLWAGSGFEFLGTIAPGSPLNARTTNSRFHDPTPGNESVNMALYTWQLLNDANVAVYPIDTRRAANSAFQSMDPTVKYSPSDAAKQSLRDTDRGILDTFQLMAANTGGKPCIYRTDLRNCLMEATEDNHDYYLVGFYVDKNNKKTGWHKINVKFAQKATVRYRQGFLISDYKPEAARGADIQLALNSPFNYTSLPFQGQFTGFKDNGAKKTTGYELLIPPDSITIDPSENQINFDVLAVVRGNGGVEAGRVAQRINRKLNADNIADIKAHGIDYMNKVDLPPGDYRVWFVLRDNPSGRTGSVVVPLKVQ